MVSRARNCRVTRPPCGTWPGSPPCSGTATPISSSIRPAGRSRTRSRWPSRWRRASPSWRRTRHGGSRSPGRSPKRPRSTKPTCWRPWRPTSARWSRRRRSSTAGSRRPGGTGRGRDPGILLLFNGKAGCAACHAGWAFTDHAFHDIGLPGIDPGRGRAIGLPAADHAFKTPGLRELARTAPYMHDGRFATLDEVLDHYAGGIVDGRPFAGPAAAGADGNGAQPAAGVPGHPHRRNAHAGAGGRRTAAAARAGQRHRPRAAARQAVRAAARPRWPQVRR